MLLKLNIWGVVCWHLLTVFVTGSGSAKAPNASNEVRFLFRCDNYSNGTVLLKMSFSPHLFHILIPPWSSWVNRNILHTNGWFLDIQFANIQVEPSELARAPSSTWSGAIATSLSTTIAIRSTNQRGIFAGNGMCVQEGIRFSMTTIPTSWFLMMPVTTDLPTFSEDSDCIVMTSLACSLWRIL